LGERREALPLLLLARRGAVDVRRHALVQLRSVIVTASDRLREELRGLPVRRLLERCGRLRRSGSGGADELATRLVLRSLARRIEAATAEATELEREILVHVRASAPRLLDEPGVGPIVAAQLLVAWSHRGTRSSSTAASTTPRPGTTSRGVPSRARAVATPPACSSATSLATSTGYCNTRSR
jgi:transposase